VSHSVGEVVNGVTECGTVQLPLAAEVVGHSARVETGPGADGADRSPPVPRLGEQGDCGGEQALAGRWSHTFVCMS
jgi:hypothetical protein